MHNNYFFLRQLSSQLQQLLGNGKAQLDHAFSQQKDELILVFRLLDGDKITEENTFYIRATLGQQLCHLSFPSTFNRANRNSATLFEDLTGRPITIAEMAQSDRSFRLIFTPAIKSTAVDQDGIVDTLAFKMHGNRCNIIWLQNDAAVGVFNHNLQHDSSITWQSLQKDINYAPNLLATIDTVAALKKVIFTVGNIGLDWLRDQSYDTLPESDRYLLLTQLFGYLNANYYVVYKPAVGPVVLSMLPIGVEDATQAIIYYEGNSAIEACNAFSRYASGGIYLERERAQLLQALSKRQSQTSAFLRKQEERFSALADGIPPNHIADILMANLHAIPATKLATVTLHNFYTDTPIDIKLKVDLTPQRNAENYYRKAKNQAQEIAHIEAITQSKTQQLEDIGKLMASIASIDQIKALRQFAKANGLEAIAEAQEEKQLPYRAFNYQGFQIWVGKDAKRNDILTQRFGYKEDLWLHARDVAGSHVLLKYQAGKPFPNAVITFAAQLAAWYSKRKTDTLAPVIVTPRKHIRKPKGALPGQVMVGKEESVVLVVPTGPLK